MKSYKSGKTNDSRSTRSRMETINKNGSSKTIKSDLYTDTKENFETTTEYRDKNRSKNLETGNNDKLETMSQRKNSSRNILEENKYPPRKMDHDKVSPSRLRLEKIKNMNKPNKDKSSLHLSAYAEAQSVHSSAMSNSSKVETREINIDSIAPRLEQRLENYNSNENNMEIKPIDIDMQYNRDIEEFDDFTDKQKEFINKVLDK